MQKLCVKSGSTSLVKKFGALLGLQCLENKLKWNWLAECPSAVITKLDGRHKLNGRDSQEYLNCITCPGNEFDIRFLYSNNDFLVAVNHMHNELCAF